MLVPGSARPTHFSQPQDCSCHHFSGKWPFDTDLAVASLHILFIHTASQRVQETSSDGKDGSHGAGQSKVSDPYQDQDQARRPCLGGGFSLKLSLCHVSQPQIYRRQRACNYLAEAACDNQYEQNILNNNFFQDEAFLAILQQPPPTQSCRIIEFLAKFLEFFLKYPSFFS